MASGGGSAITSLPPPRRRELRAPGTGITGTYKVRATLVVSGDTFSGPFLTEIFALDGTSLFSVTGSVTGQRIEVEPL
jgi:hypothetical protein